MAAIASVFTIGYVANLLGEDEDWLHELSIDMFPEDGRLWVYGVGEDGVTAFTQDGIENLRQIALPSGEYRRLGYCVDLTCDGARPAARSSAMICCKHSMPYWVKAVTPCSPTPETRRQLSSGNMSIDSSCSQSSSSLSMLAT